MKVPLSFFRFGDLELLNFAAHDLLQNILAILLCIILLQVLQLIFIFKLFSLHFNNLKFDFFVEF